jgi:DNA ligase 4
VEETTVYPAPPLNHGSAPFHVLVGLFDKLQGERKPERRRKMLDAWFNVCISWSLLRERDSDRVVVRSLQHWRAEKGYDLYPVLRLILPQACYMRSITLQLH